MDSMYSSVLMVSLTIDKKNDKYEYHCYGVAEVRSGVYNDNQVEYLDINIKETIDNGFDKKLFKRIRK